MNNSNMWAGNQGIRDTGYEAGVIAACERMTDDIDDSRACRRLSRQTAPQAPTGLSAIEGVAWRAGYAAGWSAACIDRAQLLGGWGTPPVSSPRICAAVQRSLAANVARTVGGAS